MTGEDAKALRLQAGMSQAEFGEAIGMSREMVGRMERGTEAIERRTELAMRYVARNGPLEPRSLEAVHREVERLLDEAAVRGRTGIDGMRQLVASAADWSRSGGSEVGAALLGSAQGTIGILNSSPDHHPIRDRTFEDLRQLKIAWHALRPVTTSA